MSSVSLPDVTDWGEAIEKINAEIKHVNEVTEKTIATLEAQKRELRRSTDPNVKLLQADIENITLEHDRIVERLLQQKFDVPQRIASVDQVDYTISELDKEISRIQCERDIQIDKLERKKSHIRQRLASVNNLNELIYTLDRQIDSTTHEFTNEMKQATSKREEIQADTDMTDSEKALALANLDREIAEKQETYMQCLDSLKQQKDATSLRVKELNIGTDKANDLALNIQNEISALEAKKLGATVSELEEINQQIYQLRKHRKEIDVLGELDRRGLRLNKSNHILTESGRILTIAEANKAGLLEGMDVQQLLVKEKLRERGLQLTRSGNIHTQSGRIITIDNATQEGLLDKSDIGALVKGGLLDKYDTTALEKEEESRAATITSTEDTFVGMASEDVEYLKVVLGKPLTLALAEICAKQPRDPIQYLGHWLLKYRYNQEIDEVQKREIEELIAERERIRRETWQREIEDAAKATVLEMVFKAQDQAIKMELERIAKMQETIEEENDELAEEAKDTLGELGPPVSQRVPS